MWQTVDYNGNTVKWYEAELINKIIRECQEAIDTYDKEQFYEDDCDNYTGCYYRKYLRLELEHNTICYNLGLLEQENENLKKEVKQIGSDFIKKGDYARELEQERDELKFENDRYKQLLKGCPTEDEDCGFCVIDEQNKRLKQENKELKEENANLKSLIWYIHCCGEVETIDCIITEYYESRQTQYEKGFWKKVCALKNVPYQSKYKAILEEIREMSKKSADVFDCTGCYDIYNKINEVLQ